MYTLFCWRKLGIFFVLFIGVLRSVDAASIEDSEVLLDLSTRKRNYSDQGLGVILDEIATLVRDTREDAESISGHILSKYFAKSRHENSECTAPSGVNRESDSEKPHSAEERNPRDSERAISGHKQEIIFEGIKLLERHPPQCVNRSLLRNLQCVRSWARYDRRTRYATSKEQESVPKVFRYDIFNLLERELQRHSEQDCFDEGFMRMINDNVELRKTALDRGQGRSLEELDEEIQKCEDTDKLTDKLTDALVLKEALLAELTFLSQKREKKRVQRARKKSRENPHKTRRMAEVEKGTEAEISVASDDHCYPPSEELNGLMRNVESQEERLGLANAEQGTGNASLVDGSMSTSKKVSEFSAIDIFEQGASTQSVKLSLLNDLICLREWSRQHQKDWYAAKKQGNEIQNPVPKVLRYDRFNLLVRELNLHTDRSVFDSSFMDRVNDTLKLRDSARKKGKGRTVEELDEKFSQRVSRAKDTDETSETITDARLLKEALDEKRSQSVSRAKDTDETSETITDALLLKEALESEMTYLSHRRKITRKSQAKQCTQNPKRSVVEDERVVEEGMEVDSETVVADVCDDLMDESALCVCPQSGSQMRNVENLQKILDSLNAGEDQMRAASLGHCKLTADHCDTPADSEVSREDDSVAALSLDLLDAIGLNEESQVSVFSKYLEGLNEENLPMLANSIWPCGSLSNLPNFSDNMLT